MGGPGIDRDADLLAGAGGDAVTENAHDLGGANEADHVGLGPGRLDHLVDILPSPGLTDSVTIIFLATECSPVERDLHGPEEQHMTLLHLPLGDAVQRVVDGVITDAKSVAGLLLADRRLRSSDETSDPSSVRPASRG